jgi:hypothetical protein
MFPTRYFFPKVGEDQTEGGKVCGTPTFVLRISGTPSFEPRVSGTPTFAPRVAGTPETEEC